MTLLECRSNVMKCSKCNNISAAISPKGRDIGLNYVTPAIPAEVVFIAESPPASNSNFFYKPDATNTRFRNRLFKLINLSGLKPVTDINEFTTRGYYLADAINCGWDKSVNSQPTERQIELVIENCLGYLEIQLRSLRPKAVVIMGKVAAMACHSPQISRVLAELSIFETRIITIPFILIAHVSTQDIVDSLKNIKGIGR